ncbi:MAG TPA: DUF1643 domain-containing protein [Leptolyngbyaceae cyanobacterium M33_DOE_097]|uniref:DUF1643 domain-containing protein n=1 Tax=Oscillatoriales cyanobacterium SpSt-418 TaxID=2282169 RepID=A0A7C3PKR8_9CYAN|nr:DUF1643 domain-containing protein [Leptolyngbyaceae cyanobacterium M33_DOE_097]
MKTGAVFDPTGTYRYTLWRKWDETQPSVGFIMLNPSRADAELDDPTIRRCVSLAKQWGYGAIAVGNLFAYCTAFPQELKKAKKPIGKENDRYLVELCQQVNTLILAWGNAGSLMARDRAVLKIVQPYTTAFCLGKTKVGHPRHPLYLPKTTCPTQF